MVLGQLFLQLFLLMFLLLGLEFLELLLFEHIFQKVRLVELDGVNYGVEQLLGRLVYYAVLEDLFNDATHFVIPFFEKFHGFFVGFPGEIHCLQRFLENHALIVNFCQQLFEIELFCSATMALTIHVLRS